MVLDTNIQVQQKSHDDQRAYLGFGNLNQQSGVFDRPKTSAASMDFYPNVQNNI